MSGFTFFISVGRYGGFYAYHRFAWRICLGWVAVTVVPADDDWLLRALSVAGNRERKDEAVRS